MAVEERAALEIGNGGGRSPRKLTINGVLHAVLLVLLLFTNPESRSLFDSRRLAIPSPGLLKNDVGDALGGVRLGRVRAALAIDRRRAGR